jgi:hypothetical protein
MLTGHEIAMLRVYGTEIKTRRMHALLEDGQPAIRVQGSGGQL